MIIKLKDLLYFAFIDLVNAEDSIDPNKSLIEVREKLYAAIAILETNLPQRVIDGKPDPDCEFCGGKGYHSKPKQECRCICG